MHHLFKLLSILVALGFANTAALDKRQYCGGLNSQCGGSSFEGASCCQEGLTCVVKSEMYSQCLTSTLNDGNEMSPEQLDPAIPKKDFRKPFPGSNPNYYWRNEGECVTPRKRKEWRYMSKAEQKAYTTAVNCANKQEALSSSVVPGAKTRFDDFCGCHIRQTGLVHNVGHFLAWHRLYLSFFEEYLAAECGYTGGIPYWDWSLDSDPATLPQSPIFAADAFGGNGPWKEGSGPSVGGIDFPDRTGGGCVTDGAFVNMTVNLGPGNSLAANPRCLQRDLVPALAVNFEKSRVDKVLAAPDFDSFDKAIEPIPGFTFGPNGMEVDVNNTGVHAAGHFVIGGSLGTMGSVYSSCGDPTFLLHHGNMDRLWWIWQNSQPDRLYEIGGVTTRGEPVTLDLNLHLNELTAPWPDITVREMMNIKGGPLCYDYE